MNRREGGRGRGTGRPGERGEEGRGGAEERDCGGVEGEGEAEVEKEEVREEERKRRIRGGEEKRGRSRGEEGVGEKVEGEERVLFFRPQHNSLELLLWAEVVLLSALTAVGCRRVVPVPAATAASAALLRPLHRLAMPPITEVHVAIARHRLSQPPTLLSTSQHQQ